MNSDKSFGALHKLKSKILIDRLFDRTETQNQSFLIYPLKVVFYSENKTDAGFLPQILVSVSKRKFKKSVDRNLIKRRIREAYRIQKLEFKSKLNIGFVYVSNEILEFNVLEKSMQRCLVKIKACE